MAKKVIAKSNNAPYYAIVAIVAIVAVVFLIFSFVGTTPVSEEVVEESVVEDGDEALAGEAVKYRSARRVAPKKTQSSQRMRVEVECPTTLFTDYTWPPAFHIDDDIWNNDALNIEYATCGHDRIYCKYGHLGNIIKVVWRDCNNAESVSPTGGNSCYCDQ